MPKHGHLPMRCPRGGGNHYEVTLTDSESGVSQRGVSRIAGAPAGFIGIQSYPNSPVAFRDIWVK